MIPNPFRQEVFNVLLAQLLQERGVVTAPESIIKTGILQERRMPDVIVSFQGLRTTIEGEFDRGNDAEQRAINSARKRVEESIAHIGLAVIYPSNLRIHDFSVLKKDLSHANLRFAIVTESHETEFAEGNVDQLESSLRHAFEHLIEEDVVAQAVALIDATIEKFASVMSTKEGIMGRVAEELGIRELSDDKE